MTTPDVPLRLEFSVEVPGTPEQVWEAIATANGISAWMTPTDLDEREGGALTFHMGPDASSDGTVTGWDPPRRLVYQEPDWAGLMGRQDAEVTPLVTEFLVEAQSGGTCVVHVVSSAFGTGADWEREFFDDMETHWVPMFDTLRLYLTHFPGQRVTTMSASADLPGDTATVWSVVREAIAGEVEARGLNGAVEKASDLMLLLRLDGAVPGLLGLYAYDKGEGTTAVGMEARFFAQDAAAYVEREQPAWAAWLQGLAIPAA
jgi:uncharacterized protein YndB with AHSA1/START domain